MSDSAKIYLLAFIAFLIATSQLVIGGIVDQIALSLNISVAAAGQLMTASALANAIGTPLIMMAAARLNQRKLMLWSLGILFISMIGTAIGRDYGILMAFRGLLGIAFGVYSVTSYTIAVRIAPVGRQARSMATIALGASLALVIGVPIGRVIATTFNWQLIFWGIGIMMLGALVVSIRAIPAAEGQSPPPLGEQLAYLKQPTIAAALAVPLVMFIGYSALNTYITPFLIGTLPLSEAGISSILLGLGLASAVGAKLSGTFGDRIGAGRTVVLGTICQTAALLALSLLPNSVPLTVPLLLFWAASAWTAGPMLRLTLIALAPGASGILLSLNGSFVQLGFAAGAAVGGIAVTHAPIGAISWTAAVAAGISAIIAALAFGSSKQAQSAAEAESLP